MLYKRQGVWVIILSFLLALMLTAIPLPIWAQAWRPAWVAMVLIYWCVALPERIGVLYADNAVSARPFLTSELRLVAMLGTVIAVILDNALKYLSDE